MEWQPKRWLAVLLSLLNAPLGLLYVQRGRLAVGYLLASLALQVATIGLFVLVPRTTTAAMFAATVGINLVAAIHAYRLARTPSSGARRWYSRWYGLIAFLVVLYGAAMLFRSFLYEPFRVPSEAMHPTLPEGSFVFVKKLGYGDYGSLGWRIRRLPATATVSRGEIILFRVSASEDTVYIKRVIGLPGDHVQCLNAGLVINGTPVPTTSVDKVEKKYLFQREVLDGVSYTVARLPQFPVKECDLVVPEDEYFMLGDNRENSRDSRFLGTVPRDRLVGRAALIIPATVSP